MLNAIKEIAEREGITHDEAKATVEEAVEICLEMNFNGDGDPEEEWTHLTGLEPDYLIDYLL